MATTLITALRQHPVLKDAYFITIRESFETASGENEVRLFFDEAPENGSEIRSNVFAFLSIHGRRKNWNVRLFADYGPHHDLDTIEQAVLTSRPSVLAEKARDTAKNPVPPVPENKPVPTLRFTYKPGAPARQITVVQESDSIVALCIDGVSFARLSSCGKLGLDVRTETAEKLTALGLEMETTKGEFYTGQPYCRLAKSRRISIANL